jgi:hypothetical protein
MADSVILDRAERFLRSKALTEPSPEVVKTHRDLIEYVGRLDERRRICVEEIRNLERESRTHYLAVGLGRARHLLEALDPLTEHLEAKT